MARENPAVNGASGSRLGRNVQSLLRDGMLLADLQLQLFVADVRQFWSTAKIQLALAGGLAVVILASLTVLLIGAAHQLQTWAGLPAGLAELIVGFTATVLAVSGLWFINRRLTAATEPLRQSQQELRENLNWLRETLRHEDD